VTVIDASFLVDALSESPRSAAARRELARMERLDTPQILVAEVASAIRSLVARGELGEADAVAALHDAMLAPTTTHPIEPLLPRVWELRHVLSVYDAWYVALAEALDVDLVTTDERLQRAPGVRCTVRAPAA
jgi:predicted nucleic acid-binding protein